MNKKEYSKTNKPHNPIKGRRIKEKPEDFKGSLKKLLKYLSSYKLGILLCILFAIGSSIFSIMGPKILGNATTEIANGMMNKLTGNGGIDFTKIQSILLNLLYLYLISMSFSMIQSLIMSDITQKISYRLRRELSLKMNKIPLKYFEERTNGEVLSIITNDIDTLSSNLSQSLSQVISSIVTLIGIVIMMLTISPILTGASCLILPVSFLLIMLVVKCSQKYFMTQQEYLAEVNSQVEEVYTGHAIVKAFNQEEATKEKFEQANDTLYNSAWKSQFLSGMMHPIMNFIGNLGYVMISILGGYLTIKNQLEIGYILSFSQYIRQFNHPIAQSAQIVNLLQSTVAAAERVFRFLELEEETEEETEEVETSKMKGDVEFKNVCFGYQEENPVIEKLNLKVKAGKKIAIVGPTGAGKTTIVKLLMRFYDVTSGEILIDGKNIKQYTRKDLRSLFGMVLQDTWLFTGTIEENMKYGKLEATPEEIEEVAKLSHIDHFIKTLPDTYNMLINEEADNISEGQKQLLTIARVILKDPKILILDEATSSVDTRLETLIQEAMDKLMEGRTSFIIAHRLSTIRNADTILVMQDGKIAEKGTHKTLLKKKGAYFNLYNAQFEEKKPRKKSTKKQGK